ncbi:hypothetical protein SRB5_44120 [Streptomyces sp. RB5]|uniref:Esterase n=1 Tax=Streptomyces smaragdinus TaxID=2585196 RepID=A0A7K0CL84_9ACTN|nr:FG-GAP repeat protein [Streptomyces smaragdinus]MQY14249.1 hypothetical protein [Streptomyces smaragdinus]
MRHFKSAALTAAALLTLGGGAIWAAPAAQAATPALSIGWQQRNCDYNGDGRDDILTGAPGATVGGAKGAGYITVQYSTSAGISTAKRTVLSQNSSGVPGGAEAGDGFGKAVASSDLDFDGYDDAIVGIPGEDLAGLSDTGAVTVFWGSSTGLHGSDSTWLEDPDELLAGANFGRAVEGAHYFALDPANPEANARDSLAVLEDNALLFFTVPPGGALKSGAPRLTAAERSVQAKDVAPKAAAGFEFRNLSHGNYDEDMYADLAVSGVDSAGVSTVAVMMGGPDFDALELGDGGVFEGGPAIVSGDWDGTGQDDLVTGDTGTGSPKGGAITIYLGRGDLGGLEQEPAQYWNQDSDGVPGGSETGDQWGADLSAGDTDGDGLPDLAVGAPGEDIGTVSNAGAVWVLRGSRGGGFTNVGVKSFDQALSTIPGAAETSDRWGGQVRLFDANGDKLFGLLAAAPGENTNDGVVWVLQPSKSGITGSGSWTYGGGTLGASASNAQFGAAIDE